MRLFLVKKSHCEMFYNTRLLPYMLSLLLFPFQVKTRKKKKETQATHINSQKFFVIWQFDKFFFCFALSLIPNDNAIKVLLPKIDEMKLV